MKKSIFIYFRPLFLLFVFIFLSLNSKGQNKPIRIIKYTNENCYSRSIKIFQNQVITGNSNGEIYSVNLKNNKIKCLTDGIELAEIRDIEISGNSILGLQSADSGAVVLVDFIDTPKVYTGELLNWNQRFLDGMAIHNNSGFIMGDPIGDKFSLYYSKDGGKNWFKSSSELSSYEGEAGFAASGTNVQILNDSLVYFVSGGIKSRFFKSDDFGVNWKNTELPYSSLNSSGAYSLCMINEYNGVIVGGDYTKPDEAKLICFYTNDGGNIWKASEIQPLGYRSCVTNHNNLLFCCGTNGIDYSIDFGKTWRPFCQGNYFSLTTHKGKLFATTTNGTFHIFKLPKK
jgi:hypothetical protein